MKNLILKQGVMNKVLYALTPIILFSIFLYGWRSLVLVLFTNSIAFLTEYLMVKNKPNGKVSMAVFVSATLLVLSLPPTLPLWIAGVGAVVAILFGKMVFGGFGTNIFNPAIVGRTFIYISFPKEMTVSWVKPFTSFPGGFLHYQTADAFQKISSATPVGLLKSGINQSSISDLFWGTIPGSMGESSAFLIIIAAIYLIWTKTAKWQPMLACLLSFSLFTALFNPDLTLTYLLSGGLLFGTVFMITDPISMAKTNLGIWIYGILVGFLTVFIRKFSLFSEGFMFALLISNSFMPIIDYAIQKAKTAKTARSS